jgi:gluconokinase
VTRALVVMGVSGSGKSTLGRALGQHLGWRFVEGDTLHPPANIAKMAAGLPLDDADRRPFLDAVAQVIVDAQGTGIVVSCSALKRSYRDLIRARAGAVRFVLPEMSREQLAARLLQRRAHFMPVSLLDSQLATLEAPEPGEQAIRVDGAASTEVQVAQVLAAITARDVPSSHDTDAP